MVMTPGSERAALLERARLWAEQAQSVLGSRQQLDRRYLLMVLALGSATALLLGLHSLLLLWQGASQVRSPWPLLIGGVACMALWAHAQRRGNAPVRLLVLVSALLCAGNVVAIGLNGVMGLTFVTGLVVVVHLLLAPRVALAVGGAYLLCALSALWWYDGALDPGLSVRALVTGAAALVAMQLLARHWDDIGNRLYRLTREISAVIAQTEAEIDRVRRETTQLERTDPMTGLPNRLGFLEQAADRLQSQPQSVLVCLRLTRWRSALAALAYSDQKALTERLVSGMSDLLGEQALVGRIGPEDFAVLLPGEGPRCEDTVQRLGMLQEALARPVVVRPLTALTDPLLGFSRAPFDSREVQELMRQAETACLSGEGSATDAPQPFDLLLQRKLSEREQAEKAFAIAVELGQLELDLQPIVQTASRVAVGAETRVMWNHPQLGRVSAAAVLPRRAAPQLSERITRWKLQAAAGQAARMAERSGRPFFLGVNLPSAWLQRTIREPGTFLDQLLALGLAPRSLCLEIPEEALLADIADLSQWITLVKSLGVSLAIDHFGAGYSCFGQLDRLRVDFLKMDRAFVGRVGQGSRETAVCRAIVRVAHELGLQVVADGAAGAEQVQHLAEIGCDLLQGPGVAPTLRPDALASWLTTPPAA